MIRSPYDVTEGGFLAIMILVVVALAGVFITPIALVGIPAYFAYRIYRDSPTRHERLAKEQTDTLFKAIQEANVVLDDEEIEDVLLAEVPAGTPRIVQEQLIAIGQDLYRSENITADIPPPPPLHNTVEGARYRDMISRTAQASMDRNMAMSALATIAKTLGVIAREVPAMEGELLVPITQFLERPNNIVEELIAPFFAENDYQHFKQLRERLDANLADTHRTNPIWPTNYKGEDVAQIYLKGTALLDLFAIKAPFAIPEQVRFEHTHIVGGTGHGKTQTLQYQIVRDLDDVANGDKTVIVIDSQGELIANLLKARILPPDRIVLIDPEDIAYPVCLNLFSVGQERLQGYGDLERERLTNSIIELYDFVLGSLLSAAMTAKQSVVFRYVTRLLFQIPGATIHTFRELMEPGGSEKYREHIDKLDGTARSFFANEFDTNEFEQTKRQVLRRLYAVLENRTFERMFSFPQSKFDMFTEMNAGKLILINTAKSLLKEEGTTIFGRFFIALITQAAQERATIAASKRTPVICYVDEAHEYFDANIAIILAQARKFRVAMVMAHQYLGQLDAKLQEAFEANTSIKMAGGISMRDARVMANQFNCDPDELYRQPKGMFVTYVRGLTKKGLPISFPFFVLENAPRASRDEQDEVRGLSRKRYAEPFKQNGAKDPAGREGETGEDGSNGENGNGSAEDTNASRQNESDAKAKAGKKKPTDRDGNDEDPDDDPTDPKPSW